MQLRNFKLRLRRRLRLGEQEIDQHLLRRFDRLVPIKRFILAWVGLLVLLIGGVVGQNLALSNYYQTVKTVPGGIYSEGILGRFTNANPLYATSDADSTVSRLVFSGLLTYDRGGKLVGDLASSYRVDAQGRSYTVKLKPGLTWHDGRPLTSADVLFTYQLIQNPDAQSPLQSSWQGIQVTAPDDQTIVFKLPGVLASFPHNLTNGIVPKHLLAKTPPADLRSADFNTRRPVGAGPFTWQSLQVIERDDPKTAQIQIGLTPFSRYQAGQPKLQRMVIKVFADEKQLTKAFVDNQLTAVGGLNTVPPELENEPSVVQHNLPLRAATMVFFKTSSGVLANQPVRKALVQATDNTEIIEQLGYPSRAVREPLLIGQIGYDHTLAQPKFNLKAAQEILEKEGWVIGRNDIRSKAGQPLTFTLSVANTKEYRTVAQLLQRQWDRLGAKIAIRYLETTDFQNALTHHDYDAVLNGITIGADPDVYVYWHSSQADIRSTNRLNLSEYKNPTADAALEAGRTRNDPALRTIKYRPFLQAWQQDNPAVGLYQPRYLYLTNGPVSGFVDNPINSPLGRFVNVHNWQIREAKVTN